MINIDFDSMNDYTGINLETREQRPLSEQIESETLKSIYTTLKARYDDYSNRHSDLIADSTGFNYADERTDERFSDDKQTEFIDITSKLNEYSEIIDHIDNILDEINGQYKELTGFNIESGKYASLFDKIPQPNEKDFINPINILITGITVSQEKRTELIKSFSEKKEIDPHFKIYSDGWKDGLHGQLKTAIETLNIQLIELSPDWRLGKQHAMKQRHDLITFYAKTCSSAIIGTTGYYYQPNIDLVDDLKESQPNIKIFNVS